MDTNVSVYVTVKRIKDQMVTLEFAAYAGSEQLIREEHTLERDERLDFKADLDEILVALDRVPAGREGMT
jgi:hypothetical protein